MQNRFNLIDEPWVPVAGHGAVSLRQIFADTALHTLGGTALEKIAITKLLLAIAQAAHTPEDTQSWQALGKAGLMQACLDYLSKWHDHFYLYGERPFLQMPAIEAAKVKSFGAMLPEIAGNTTILTQTNVERPLSEAQMAVLLIVQMSLALGGKKKQTTALCFLKGIRGRVTPKVSLQQGKAGPALAHMGLLHSFVGGETLQSTLWLNLLTHQDIAEMGLFSQGLGQALGVDANR